jgi:hypothetical protein
VGRVESHFLAAPPAVRKHVLHLGEDTDSACLSWRGTGQAQDDASHRGLHEAAQNTLFVPARRAPHASAARQYR